MGALNDHGVTDVFSLSGNQILPVYDALNETSIRLVHTRHEAAAVFMAEAYARVSGRLGVALVAAGPGFGNTLGALYSASLSETPVLLLSGDSPLYKNSDGAFQQLDQTTAAGPFVKASFRLAADNDPAALISRAASIARNGIPGPVHIALPFDVIDGVQVDDSESSLNDEDVQLRKGEDEIDSELTTQILDILSTAKRPLVLVGPHLFRAERRKNHSALSLALSAPVIVLDSPRGIGDPAQGALKEVLQDADCIFYLGKPIDFTSGIGNPEVISADKVIVISEVETTRVRAATLFEDRLAFSSPANAVALTDALLDHVGKINDAKQISKDRENWIETVTAYLDHRQLVSADSNSLYSKQVVEIVDQAIKQHPDCILISDGGEFGQWAQAYTFTDRRLTNGPSGAIGASIPYAIGAKAACQNAPVIAVLGDGSAGFHICEFETAARESLAISVVIGNDSRWNAEHVNQVERYGIDRTIGCDLSNNVRYDLVAEALGCDGILVSDLDQLREALDHGLSSSATVCINVLIPGAPAPRYTALHNTGIENSWK